MVNNSILFNMLKPATNYEIIVGGMALPIDVENGTILINYINNIPLSKSNKKMAVDDNKEPIIKEGSVLQEQLQLDFYRINPLNNLYIDAYLECENVKEYLKSYQVQEYLKSFNIELLPIVNTTTYLTDLTEQKKLVNRAFFEVSLIYDSLEIIENIDTINKIIFTKSYILQEGFKWHKQQVYL